MNKKIIQLLIILGAGIILSGCLYPQDQRIQNQLPYEEQLNSVQSAVDQFNENTSVLPIRNQEASIPIFRKYPIDFQRLIPEYIQDAPGNSFEAGGIYQYVLVDVEQDPIVKLIDLRVTRAVQELERNLNSFRNENGYIPVLEEVSSGIFHINFAELGYKEDVTIDSPYHPTHQLPVYIHSNGEVVIDYYLDILYFADEFGTEAFESGEDINYLLIEHAPFVPINSKPQMIENNEVIYFDNE